MIHHSKSKVRIRHANFAETVKNTVFMNKAQAPGQTVVECASLGEGESSLSTCNLRELTFAWRVAIPELSHSCPPDLAW